MNEDIDKILDDVISSNSDSIAGEPDMSDVPATPLEFMQPIYLHDLEDDQDDELSDGTEAHSDAEDLLRSNTEYVPGWNFEEGISISGSIDDRPMSAEDIAKAREDMRQLEEWFANSQSGTEHLKLLGEFKQVDNFLAAIESDIGKLNDYKVAIMRDGVSQNNYDGMVAMNVGMESRLPSRDLYTKNPSMINLVPTLEAIDAQTAALGAGAGILIVGLLYKLFMWIKEKFFDKSNKASAVVDKAKDTVEKAESGIKSNPATVNSSTIKSVDLSSPKYTSLGGAIAKKLVGELSVNTTTDDLVSRISGEVLKDTQGVVAMCIADGSKATTLKDQLNAAFSWVTGHAVPRANEIMNEVEEILKNGKVAESSKPKEDTVKKGLGIKGFFGGMKDATKDFFGGKRTITKSTNEIMTQIQELADVGQKLNNSEFKTITDAMLKRTKDFHENIKDKLPKTDKDVRKHIDVPLKELKTITDLVTQIVMFTSKNLHDSGVLAVKMAQATSALQDINDKINSQKKQMIDKQMSS